MAEQVDHTRVDDARLDRVFAALADPTRRDLVARLASTDATVGELAAPYDVPGGAKSISASIDLCARTGPEGADDLVAGSDAAMYTAKAAGGGRVQVLAACLQHA